MLSVVMNLSETILFAHSLLFRFNIILAKFFRLCKQKILKTLKFSTIAYFYLQLSCAFLQGLAEHPF